MFSRGCRAALAFAPVLLGCAGADDPGERGGEGVPPEPAGERSRVSATSVDDVPGAALLRELGCGACHPGAPAAGTARDRAPRFGPGGRDYDPGFLLDYLQDPARVRPDIGRSRMPDFHLSEAESLALALYLIRARDGDASEAGSRFREARRQHPDATAERGRRIFRALNCVGCHRGTGVEPWRPGPDLGRQARRVREGWLRRWLLRPRALRPFGLRPGTGSRMPDFRLSEAEVDTLTDFLLASAPADPGEAHPDFEPPRLSPYQEAKAAALLDGRLPCLGCHRLNGRGGRVGPALDGVGERRPAGYVWGVVRSPARHAPGTVMPPTPVPEEHQRLVVSYLLRERETADEDREAGYLSLVDHPLRRPEGHELEPGEGDPAGGPLYRSRCASCHGVGGSGNGYNARYLPVRPTVHSAADQMSVRTDATLFDGIHAGGRILDRSHLMPAFGEALSRDQTWSLVDHIRDLCDCRGPDWARDDPAGSAGGGNGG